MRTNIIKKLFVNTFLISVLLHLFLLLSLFIFFYPAKEEKQKPPHLFVPAYVYKTTSATLQQHSASKSSLTKTQKENHTPKTEQPSNPKNTIAAPKTTRSRYATQIEKKPPQTFHQNQPKSMLAATQAFLRQSLHHSISAPKDQDPIYLIGDTNAVSDPLIKLMGKALSAHFEYPKMAGEFGIKGRVLVKLTLHPEGYFSDVQMIQSSNNQDLDAAALYAVNAAPLVYGADRFITSPKNFVVGFIFR